MTQPPATAAPVSLPRLGELLVQSGALTEQQRQASLAAQQERGDRMGEVVTRLGFADSQTVTEALCRQRGLDSVDAAETVPEQHALDQLPAEVAFKYRALPLTDDGRTLTLAMADPLDNAALEVVRSLTGRRLNRKLANPDALADAIGRHYGSNAERMIATLGGGDAAALDDDATDLEHHLQELASEPTVVNLVNLLIYEAIEARASDIHVEPFEHTLKVKYRIDGLLHEMKPPPKHLQDAITSRLKIMAGMNIAERFVPQDGHIDFNTARGKIDLRVATAPTVFGESVVLRILDRTAALFALDKLGLDHDRLTLFKDTLDTPHGIVLVTGPTGSGKSTTLYAALQHIYSPQLKIITIEDPVEFQIDGINQIPVNRKRGLGFADGLRAILRQDPDVVMIGEIRDRETADIAIRAALTGHLVFSTLHTNDATGAVTRLIDMGIEPFLIASSLRAVLAQRLVRKVCGECRQPATPSEAMIHRLGHRAGNGATFYEGTGCRACRQVGYRGRMGLFELLTVSPAVREAINQRASAAKLTELLGPGHVCMGEDGYRKAAAGQTTLEEVFRVTHD